MKKKTRNIIIGIVGLIIIGIILNATGLIRLPFAITGPSGETVQLAIPHYGSFECKAYPDKVGNLVSVSSSGAFISKETVGFWTPGIKNVYIISPGYTIASRVRYSICDSMGNNCIAQTPFDSTSAGKTSIISLNLAQQSLRVYSEKRSFPDVWNWVYREGIQVSYDATPYELVYHSTTQDIAGKVVCATSCDLTCPDIGIRNKLIFTLTNILGFGQTAPSFEYWESISYDLNMQGGATVYNPSTNLFCFSGTIYTAKTTKMQNGITYLFPDVNTRQYKSCCPGATISSTYSDKVCQSNYEWKTIADTDQLTCMSDATCPNAGNVICQNKQLSSGYSCSNKDANGIGICQKATGGLVECCLNSDCNTDMTCDLSSHNCVGGNINPVCGDGKIGSGEQCDDGNTISGDGCSSSCQAEGACKVKGFTCLEDCCAGLKCIDGKCTDKVLCASCGEWAGSIFKKQENKCTSTNVIATKWYNPFTWVINLLGLTKQSMLCPIFLASVFLVFLFGVLFGKDLFAKFSAIKRKPWLLWTITIIVAGIIAWVTYMAFLIGIIILIGYILLKVLFNKTLGKVIGVFK